MKAMLCLAGLFLMTGQVIAQSSPAMDVRAVKIEGVVESLDADSGVISVHQGEGLVACLKNEDSIALSEEGKHLLWDQVRPGCLITAQCLCGAGKVVVESLVLRGMKKDFEPRETFQETLAETPIVNQGVDYGVCKRATPWSLIMAGPDGSTGRVYTLEKSTRCVDESGMPASVAKAVPGSVITVRYEEVAGRVTATEVIVGKRRTS
jgi:hypothetical protein